MPNHEITAIVPQRKFIYEGRALPDLNPEAGAERIKAMHAQDIPELATAIIEGPVNEEGYVVYTFKKRIGTKG